MCAAFKVCLLFQSSIALLFNFIVSVVSNSLALNVPDTFTTSVSVQIVVEDTGSHKVCVCVCVCVCVQNEERGCVCVCVCVSVRLIHVME